MAVHLDNLHFAPPPSGFIPNSGGSQPLVKRACFIDYFPHVKESYKGYIKQSIFEEKMKSVIRQAVESTGSLSSRSVELPVQSGLSKIPSDLIVKSDFSIDQSGLDRMTKERAINDYYQDLKNSILCGINGTEWRTPSEMNMSEDMYAQSDAYFHKAEKDVAIAVVSAGVGKAFGKVVTKFSGQTVNKLISPGTKLNSFVGKTLGKEFKLGTGIFTVEFQGVDQLMGKSVEGATELGDQLLTSKKVKQYEGFDPDYFGDNWLGNSVDFVASLSPVTKIEKKIFGKNIARKSTDFGTDLIPVVSWCKTGVTTLGNIALGFQTHEIANRMKAIEDKGNEADRKFNRDLKQTIYNDVNALYLDDIKNLIDEVGLTELTK